MSYQLEALKEFSRIPILSGLTDDEIFDFIRLCRVHRIAKGDTLFRQGDPGRSMYIIGEGALDVYLDREGGRELVAQFGSLDVVGELGLLEAQPRTATAVATAETTVYEVSGEDFDGMVRQHHPAAFKIVRGLSRLVCRRIRSVNERIEAELTGAAPPPPHTGEFEAVRATGRHAATTGTHASPGRRSAPPATGAKPALPDEPKPTGVFRRVMSRIWGGEER